MKLDRIVIIGFIKAAFVGFSYLIVGDLIEQMSLFSYLAHRFSAAALTFIFLRIFGVIKIRLKGKKIGILILLACFVPIGECTFEAIGMSMTSSLLTGIMGAFSPVIVISLEILILKESSTAKQKLFIFLSAAGVLLIAVMTGEQNNSASGLGVLLVFLSVTSNAFFMILTRKNSQEFTSIEITYVLMIVGMVFFHAINLSLHIVQGTVTQYFAPLFNMAVTLKVLYMGVISSSFVIVCNAFLLSKVQASSMTIFAGVSTAISILAGVIFKNEPFLWYHAIGTILILIGVRGVSGGRENTPLQETAPRQK